MDINFRKQSWENNTNSNNKKFISILPVNSKINLLFIFLFVVFLSASLFYIKIPTKIKVLGFVDIKNDFIIYSKNENHSIIYNFKNTEKILKKGDVLFYLKNNENNKNIIENLEREKSIKKKKLEIVEYEYVEKLDGLKTLIESQKNIVRRITEKLVFFDKFFKNKKSTYEKGLISLNELNEYQKELKNSYIEFEKSKKKLSSLKIEFKEAIIVYKKNKNDIQNEIGSIETKIQMEKNKELISIKSPCDCYIEKIYQDNHSLVVKDHPIVSFSTQEKEQKAVFFIKSSDIKDIEGKKVNLTFDSFPFLKYGSLNSRVSFLSKEIVKHPFLKNNGIDGNYFLAEASLENLSDKITLNDGMTIKGDVIIDSKPLFSYLFKEII